MFNLIGHKQFKTKKIQIQQIFETQSKRFVNLGTFHQVYLKSIFVLQTPNCKQATN